MNQFQQEVLESDPIPGKMADREFETSSDQKSWYFFDAYWREADGSLQLLGQNGPGFLTSSEATRVYDGICLTSQNNTRGRANGKLFTRCYQWFPVSSRWVACKNVVGFSRGMCASDESEVSEMNAFEMEQSVSAPTSPARPVFDLECAAGCAPFQPAQCRAVLRQAVVDAISLANNAAGKLSAPDSETIRLFRAFFGHVPSRPVPWANNRPSGAVVGLRFQQCARELGGGRRTRYRCGCPGAAPTVNARTVGPLEVRLCPAFWNASPQPGLSDRFFRAGVVLHEMLHQLYLEFIRHDPNERRRNNAHCYEVFAMRLAGHAGDQSDVRQCWMRPA